MAPHNASIIDAARASAALPRSRGKRLKLDNRIDNAANWTATRRRRRRGAHIRHRAGIARQTSRAASSCQRCALSINIDARRNGDKTIIGISRK